MGIFKNKYTLNTISLDTITIAIFQVNDDGHAMGCGGKIVVVFDYWIDIMTSTQNHWE